MYTTGLVIVEFSGQGSFCLVFQALLVAAQKEKKADNDQRGQDHGDGANRACQPMHVISKEVASQSVDGGPCDSSERIEEQKAVPGHTVCSGQEGGPGAEHGYEASKEDYFAAMFHKEVLSKLQLALVESNIAAKATEQAVASFTSDPEAQIIAQDRAAGRCRDYQGNKKAMRCTSVDGGDDEHSFTWEGDTSALNGHEEQDCPVAVGSEKMGQVERREMEH